MDKQLILELVGYAASLLVLISLLMTSVVKLRVINLIGSFIFAVYALFIASYPTAVMNFCLVGVNIFYLLRMARTERVFTLLPAALEEAYVQHFLQFYREDIQHYFALPEPSPAQTDAVFLVCCGAAPAGILTGRNLGDGVLEVSLDYSVPQYRDCSVGQYLYRQLAEQGCRALVVPSALEAHRGYLEKMGFVQENGRYVKNLVLQA
ncbi:MAG: YgjV family protein [Oscillibacter sp.]|nr:YgjV family protein [Oscillibacter sp.]